MAKEELVGEDVLTLHEMARLCGDNRDFITGEMVDKMISHVLADPRYAELIEQAEAMARDAGVDSTLAAALVHENLEELLDADGWDDPAEVLQPGDEDTSDLCHCQMINILDARMARGGDPAKLMPVKERLERHEVKYAERALKELLPCFARLSPGTAARFRDRSLTALWATQEPAAGSPGQREETP